MSKREIREKLISLFLIRGNWSSRTVEICLKNSYNNLNLLKNLNTITDEEINFLFTKHGEYKKSDNSSIWWEAVQSIVLKYCEHDCKIMCNCDREGR